MKYEGSLENNKITVCDHGWIVWEGHVLGLNLERMQQLNSLLYAFNTRLTQIRISMDPTYYEVNSFSIPGHSGVPDFLLEAKDIRKVWRHLRDNADFAKGWTWP